MSDIIQLLPDFVANQIAAGEVIQRPASVVKEMIENSVDAGATKINLNIKDAGRTLIQIIDNGRGMSPSDARMSFERHATSKIKNAQDLFALSTMGFRGEALASIAAVAEIQLKTRTESDEIGVLIHITGSELKTQEPVVCAIGSNFSVKNLFYNVPARRKFLKSNRAEFKHILTEFQRIAISNPEIAFSLHHNDSSVYELESENLKKRIVHLFGKNINQNLIPVETSTSIISIKGYIGQPKIARKTPGEQFFLVNGRFMKHPYFHKAILQAYEGILSKENIPTYFLDFTVNPSTIDVNIHPTKTEIKFEDERSAWHIIHAAVREALGKYNVAPSIEFDQEGAIDIPILFEDDKKSVSSTPSVRINKEYNPFEEESNISPSSHYSSFNESQLSQEKRSLELESNSEFPSKRRTIGEDPSIIRDEFAGAMDHFENEMSIDDSDPEFILNSKDLIEQQKFDIDKEEHNNAKFLHFKNKYILTPVKSGLMVIDQKRAHQRILYENFKQNIQNNIGVSQQQLFPHTIELSLIDSELMTHILEDLKCLGFDIRLYGQCSFVIQGVPSVLGNINALSLLEMILQELRERPVDLKSEMKEYLAKLLAKNSAIRYGIPMKTEEIEQLFNSLFCCSRPTISPFGKPVLKIMKLMDLEKFMNSM